MLEAVKEAGYEVVIPQADQALIDNQTTVSKITTWDLQAAMQLPKKVDLFLGPPGYSLAQIMKLKGQKVVGWDEDKSGNREPEVANPWIFTWVWNNADWFRDQQLAKEYAKYDVPYDLSPAWRWINKTALELSDTVIACSPFVKDTHAKLVASEKIKIAFWGVDSATFTPDWEWLERPDRPLKVLFVGGDPIRKGLPYLLEALIDLDDVKLTIVGTGITLSRPELAAKCQVLGMIPYAEMPALMRQHHVICIPTLEDGIACAVQEGMTSGLVPIATPDPAEVFEHGISGVRVNYRDVRAIQTALAILRDAPGERLKMARAARVKAESQTWTKFKEQFKAIILGMAANG